jgi:hypothetical protein
MGIIKLLTFFSWPKSHFFILKEIDLVELPLEFDTKEKSPKVFAHDTK